MLYPGRFAQNGPDKTAQMLERMLDFTVQMPGFAALSRFFVEFFMFLIISYCKEMYNGI